MRKTTPPRHPGAGRDPGLGGRSDHWTPASVRLASLLQPVAIACFLLLPLLLSAWPAHAQTGRVRVEVIVFAHNNPDAGAALSPADPDPEYVGMLLDVGSGAYTRLGPESLSAGGAAAALARHARTRSLLHTGFLQPAGDSRAIRLRGERSVESPASGGALAVAAQSELEGDLTLRFGRGVEVHVDALLRTAATDSAGRPTAGKRYRLNSRRVMNYGEWHYLDHPALGVIVRVDPVEVSGSGS
jgi:hypothetical protein